MDFVRQVSIYIRKLQNMNAVYRRCVSALDTPNWQHSMTQFTTVQCLEIIRLAVIAAKALQFESGKRQDEVTTV
jgi:hypothetical protein